MASRLTDRFYITGDRTDRTAAMQSFQETLNHSTSAITFRINSGIQLLGLYASDNHWMNTYQAASQAISLLPLLTPRSLEDSDKQNMLIEVLGLASDAAAVALNARKSTYNSITLLELGRGIISGSLNEMRTDISSLREAHPQLAEEFVNFRGQLDVSNTSASREFDVRDIASRELKLVIQRIRELSSFDRFLLAPAESRLMAAAKHGPIAVINDSQYRCDALIVEKDRLRAVPLPDLRVDDIWDRVEIKDKLEVLEWLWTTVARPVLDALECTKTPPNNL